MAEPTPPFRRFVAALRSKGGRRVLVALLLASVAAVGWWYVGRMPGEGRVEVRWTEDPPRWISIGYTDDTGSKVRWRREDVRPGTDRFRDDYKLTPGTYWVRIEYFRRDRIRSIRKRLELPSTEPLILMLDEAETP